MKKERHMDLFKIFSFMISLVLFLILLEIIARHYYLVYFPHNSREVISFNDAEYNDSEWKNIISTNLVNITSAPLYYSRDNNYIDSDYVLVGDSIRDHLHEYHFEQSFKKRFDSEIETLGMTGYNFIQYEYLIKNKMDVPEFLFLTTVSNDIMPPVQFLEKNGETYQIEYHDRVPIKGTVNSVQVKLLSSAIYKISRWINYLISDRKEDYQFFSVDVQNNRDALRDIINYADDQEFEVVILYFPTYFNTSGSFELDKYERHYRSYLKNVSSEYDISFFDLSNILNITVDYAVDADLEHNMIQHPNELYTEEVLDVLFEKRHKLYLN